MSYNLFVYTCTNDTLNFPPLLNCYFHLVITWLTYLHFYHCLKSFRSGFFCYTDHQKTITSEGVLITRWANFLKHLGLFWVTIYTFNTKTYKSFTFFKYTFNPFNSSIFKKIEEAIKVSERQSRFYLPDHNAI